MNKIEKKKLKLKERIMTLEQIVLLSLTKKSSNETEINVPKYQIEINNLKKELRGL